MTYERFTDEVLVKGLGIGGLLFGYNGNFGKDGQGTARTLAPLGARHGFLVEEAPAVAQGTQPVSSSRIRDAIEAGDLVAAADMLGRPVALLGTVVHGDGRGRTLGFPTANVDLEGEILPPAGVYEVVAEVGGRRLPAVANIGVRPTFARRSRREPAPRAPLARGPHPGPVGRPLRPDAGGRAGASPARGAALPLEGGPRPADPGRRRRRRGRSTHAPLTPRAPGKAGLPLSAGVSSPPDPRLAR